MALRSTAVLTTWLALAAAGCGAADATYPIEETRTLERARPGQAAAMDTKTRMGLDGAHGGFVHPPMSGAAGAQGVPTSAAPSLAWDLPAGWTEIAPTPLRTGNFVVPDRERLECYVTVLPGGGGGLAANLNRWRMQMALGDLSEAEVAALPRVKMLGADAPLLLADNALASAEGWSMAGVALDRAGAAVFVKMTGPSADVRAELDRFRGLVASLREMVRAAPAPAASGGGGLTWTAPEGWTEGPAKQMRLVTFVPKDAQGVECYVAVLGGAGGGLAANVNRWRQQLNLAPLSDAAIAALPTVPVLGKPSPMVEIDGGALGVIGLVCELGTQSVFVKMTGPMDALRRERERFLAFCRSLS